MLELNLDALNLREIRIYSPAYMTFYLETRFNNKKCVRTPNIAYKGVNIYCLCNKESLIWDEELSFLEENTINICLCEYNKFKLIANSSRSDKFNDPTIANLFIIPHFSKILTLKEISLTQVPDTEFYVSTNQKH